MSKVKHHKAKSKCHAGTEDQDEREPLGLDEEICLCRRAFEHWLMNLKSTEKSKLGEDVHIFDALEMFLALKRTRRDKDHRFDVAFHQRLVESRQVTSFALCASHTYCLRKPHMRSLSFISIRCLLTVCLLSAVSCLLSVVCCLSDSSRSIELFIGSGMC